ncbi:MAG: serpin family protein [Candidatus Eisenbacteria bacterium]|uniref:Serpin family protein n=1 Tax=Eiseniibacteriota bacterium TaxID=2212470 RepID=A0A948RZ40_UNCEI|nr:serpin family protein [Candidatus Eisenbacteria bacterium]MBU2692626.1 serpin family protein [Candidatus Eisenbacteria bacterium]
MERSWFLCLLSLSLLIPLTSSNANLSESKNVFDGSQPRLAQEELIRQIADMNHFSLNLYLRLSRKPGNLFFSPYSVSETLAMTYAGARGETERQMSQVLNFPTDRERLHLIQAGSRKQREQYTSGGLRFSMANSVWGQRDHTFRADYIELIQKQYGALFTAVDFRSQTEEARQAINHWAEKETHSRTEDFIESSLLDTSTILVLADIIYFKGMWARRFPIENTAEADFHLSSDRRVKSLLMSQLTELRNYDFNDFQAVEIPYDGHDLSLVLLLPKEIDGLARLEAALTLDHLDDWLDKLGESRPKLVRITIPKLNLASRLELSAPLADLGMPDLFQSGHADLSGIDGSGALFVDSVIHQATIEIDEMGSEASSSTAAVIKKRERITDLRADHPFLFMILDRHTRTLLFMGRMIDPSRP